MTLSMFISACGGGSDEGGQQDNIVIPLSSAFITAFQDSDPNLSINVIVDRGSADELTKPLTDLKIDRSLGVIQGKLKITLAGGPHVLELEYFLKDTKLNDTVFVAFTEGLNVNVSAGKSTSVDFTRKSFHYVDGDKDQCPDFIEVVKGVSWKDSSLVPLPEAPQDVQLTPANDRMTLQWLNISCATYYTIFFNATGNVTRSDGSLNDVVIDPGKDTVSYIHTGLLAETTYYYRIIAGNNAGESELSAEFSAATVKVQTGLWDAARWDAATWGN